MTLREKVARKLFEQIFPTVADHVGRWEQEKPKLLLRLRCNRGQIEVDKR